MRIFGKTAAVSIALAGGLVLAGCGSGGGGTSPGATASETSNAGTAGSQSAAPGGAADIGKGKTVAFLLPENTVTRWEQQDGPAFVEAMKKFAPGAEVKL